MPDENHTLRWRTAGEVLPRWDTPELPSRNHVFYRHEPGTIGRIRGTPAGKGIFNYSRSWVRLFANRPAPTIMGSQGGLFLHSWRDRCLSPRELAVLQDFPDSYLFCGSKASLYRQIGNAVPVGLGRAVGLCCLEMLRQRDGFTPTDQASDPTILPPWYQKNGVTILNCDALAGLRSLTTASVHCVVTSPPFWKLRDYGVSGQIGIEETVEEYIRILVQVFREVRRVLVSGGTLWVNLGDKYASNSKAGDKVFGNSEFNRNRPSRSLTKTPACRIPQGFEPKDLLMIPARFAIAMQDDGWLLRSDNIWAKPNPTPESVKDRTTRSHEHIFMFVKQRTYYFDICANQEPATTKPHFNGAGKESGAVTNVKSAVGDGARAAPRGTRNRRDVWWIATQPYKGAHFATFPEKLVENCLKPGCPKGGTVLDPFGGCGTVAVVARRLGMRAILIELNPDYCKLARQRIESARSHEGSGRNS